MAETGEAATSAGSEEGDSLTPVVASLAVLEAVWPDGRGGVFGVARIAFENQKKKKNKGTESECTFFDISTLH